ATIENITVKKEIFTELDKTAPAHTIFATNTTTLPITEIAAATTRTEKVIGMHFMNPVPIMKHVEVIRGLQTADETYQVVADITKQLNKTSVDVQDLPGFIANRLVMPLINHAS